MKIYTGASCGTKRAEALIVNKLYVASWRCAFARRVKRKERRESDLRVRSEMINLAIGS